MFYAKEKKLRRLFSSTSVSLQSVRFYSANLGLKANWAKASLQACQSFCFPFLKVGCWVLTFFGVGFCEFPARGT